MQISSPAGPSASSRTSIRGLIYALPLRPITAQVASRRSSQCSMRVTAASVRRSCAWYRS